MTKRYALCIGVNDYKNARHLNLRYASSDAVAFADILSDPLRGGFDDVRILIDDRAHKADIRQGLEDLLLDPLRQPDDLVLIYFSGHGVRDKQNDLCLVPHDFRIYPDGTIDFTSMIHAKEIEMIVGNSNIRNIVLLIDCCHSGALGKIVDVILQEENVNIFIIGGARASESALETTTLRHGVFTECVLRSLNLPPDQGEWITLGEIVRFITIEIGKFPTTQLIETTSHFINMGIPLARNPSYSTISRKFTKEVSQTFQLAGYDTQSQSDTYGYPNLFIADVRAGFGHTQTGVLCLDNREVHLTKVHIDQCISLIVQLRVNGEIADGLIVTQSNISSEMRRHVAASGVARWTTNKELLGSLINFERYLQRLIYEFDHTDPEKPGEPALANYYIELDAETQGEEEWKGLATDYLMDWSNSSRESHVALLGQYGSGKSTFCKKLARDLAERYMRSSTKEGRRIPLLINLREFPKGQADIEIFIAGHLARRCGVSNPNYDAFRVMNDAGLFLLIFDGFDEMAVHTDEDVIQANLAQIEKLTISPNSKILLTSRPEYFKTSYEERDALQPKGLMARRVKYKRLVLLPFKEKQIITFLKKRLPFIASATHDWEYYYSEIKRIHDLYDLSHRPVLLEMIVKTLPELVASGGPVDRPTLYQTYLEGELRRQAIEKRRELLIKRDSRLRMMQTLALHFYMENLPGLTADLVQVLVYDLLTPKQREELEAHTRDFLTCSFLMRRGDSYYFSHRSLVEYLTARALREEIQSGNPITFGNQLLTTEVVDFLAELVQVSDVTLDNWIASTRYKKFETVRYLGTNAITVLNHVGKDFSGADFSGAVLRGANLKQAMCKSTVFSKADMSSANLMEATIIECNFRETDLTNANLHMAKAHRADFGGAYFDHTDFLGADLTYANLENCICYASKFNEVLADHASLGYISGHDFRDLSPSVKLMSFGIGGKWLGDGGRQRLELIYVDQPQSHQLMLFGIDGKWRGKTGEQLKIENTHSEGGYCIIGVIQDALSRIEFRGDLVENKHQVGYSIEGTIFDISKSEEEGKPYFGWLTVDMQKGWVVSLQSIKKSQRSASQIFRREDVMSYRACIEGKLISPTYLFEFGGVLHLGEYFLEGMMIDNSKTDASGYPYFGWLTYGELGNLIVSLGPSRKNRDIDRRIFWPENYRRNRITS